MAFPNVLGEALKQARKERSLTQSDVANLASVSTPAVRGQENLRGTASTYVHILRAIGVELRGRNLPAGDEIHRQVRTLRQRRGISGRSLARLIGVSHPSIVNFENYGSGRLVMLNACLVVLGAGATLAPEGSPTAFYSQAGTSASSTEWNTPSDLLEKLYTAFNAFDLDPCSPTRNKQKAPVRARVYYTEEDDGLALPWFGTVFMNPPYGRTIGEWVKKAEDEARFGCTVIALLPARTDTAWWHAHVTRAEHIFFLKGRLRFNEGNSAPFPSALVVWNGDPKKTTRLREQLSASWLL